MQVSHIRLYQECIFKNQKVSNKVSYHHKNSYQLAQDIIYFLSMNSAMLNYQLKFNLINSLFYCKPGSSIIECKCKHFFIYWIIQ